MFTSDWYKDMTWLCICVTDKVSAVQTFWILFNVLLRLLYVRLKQDTLSTLLPHHAHYVNCSHFILYVSISFVKFLWRKFFSFLSFELKKIFFNWFRSWCKFCLINKSVLLFSHLQLAHIIFILRPAVCSCAELKDSSGFRSWKKHFMRRAPFQSMEKRAVIKFFSCVARCQRNSMPQSKCGWPNLNVVIFPTVLFLVLDDSNCDHPGSYWPIWQANLGRPPHLGYVKSWATGKLTWAVGYIIHEHLDRRNLSAKWVQSRLNADQERQICQSSVQSFEFFRGEVNDFLLRLVTINETWLYHNEPETMQRSVEWRHSDSPRPKLFREQNTLGNSSPRFFVSRRQIPYLFSSKEPT